MPSLKPSKKFQYTGRPLTDQEKADTRAVMIPAVIGLIVGVIWTAYTQSTYDGQPPEQLNDLATALVFLIWGFSPFIGLRRDFFPFFANPRSDAAHNTAVIALITFWAIAAGFLIAAFI